MSPWSSTSIYSQNTVKLTNIISISPHMCTGRSCHPCSPKSCGRSIMSAHAHLQRRGPGGVRTLQRSANHQGGPAVQKKICHLHQLSPIFLVLGIGVSMIIWCLIIWSAAEVVMLASSGEWLQIQMRLWLLTSCCVQATDRHWSTAWWPETPDLH